MCAHEKARVLAVVAASALSKKQILAEIGIPRRTYYDWIRQEKTRGKKSVQRRPWNRIKEEEGQPTYHWKEIVQKPPYPGIFPKTFPKSLREYLEKWISEPEPHRNRTCNRLIKRHEAYLLAGTDYTHPVSDIRKYGRDLCFTFYLLLSSVAKLVSKMLAKTLLFIESILRRKTGI